MNLSKIFPPVTTVVHSIALLLFRIGIGCLMFFGHGHAKIMSVGTQYAAQFPDPLGLGSQVSHLCAALAESAGSIFIVLGLFTRLNSLALGFTMFIAAFVIHADHPLFAPVLRGVVPGYPIVSAQGKEFALLYLFSFFLLFFLGPGKYSLDKLFFKK